MDERNLSPLVSLLDLHRHLSPSHVYIASCRGLSFKYAPIAILQL